MKTKIGLLGAGFIAGHHVRALARIPGASVGWVCDSDTKKAEGLAAAIPGAKAVSSLDRMLGEKPDAVHVLLPPNAHAAAAIACLEAGAHVFVEKPLATSSEEIARIAEAARLASRVVGVNHNLVFNPTFQKLVAALRTRKLGELEHLAITWNVPLRQLSAGQHSHWIFQSPENILLEQGVHPLSMVQFLLGDLVNASVLASDTQVLSTGREFHRRWQVSLECERGTAQLFLSFGRDFREIRVLAVGQDGSALVDLKRDVISVRTHTSHEPPLDDLFDGAGEGIGVTATAVSNFTKVILGMVKATPAFDPFGDSIAASLSSFYSAVGSGRDPDIGLARGAAVVEMCEVLGAATGERGRTSGSADLDIATPQQVESTT